MSESESNISESSPIEAPIAAEFQRDELTDADDTPLERLRHTASHVMAQAIKRLWPDAAFGVGPTIQDGFYYDVELEHRLTDQDLKAIEKEMKKIVKEKHDLERDVLSRNKAIELFQKKGQPFKVELIRDLPEDSEISVYKQGEFTDLCRGPHLDNTRDLKHFKLLSVAGAYWRGKENNPMLQRVYGTAWPTKEELKEYLYLLEEAKKRDHRKLIKDLNLAYFNPVAPAMPFFLPKGTRVYNRLVEFVRHFYREYGYEEVITPQIFDAELWKTSGHYDHYQENMYFVDPGKTHAEENSEKNSQGSQQELAIKPMNCPSHCLIYARDRKSYRDLPLRIADFGRLHRFEKSGATGGLTRVRSMSQDDAHIFCRMDQVQEEISRFLKWCFKVYEIFEFTDVKICLSTRPLDPKDRTGEDKLWDRAESALKDALDANQIQYELYPGEGAFYGPKIDFHIKDALKRTWQLSTCQLDFNLPQRFDLTYIQEDGSEERPVMIHRAIFGTIERFMGVLIEHLGGAFPFWLAPIQATLLPIGEDHVSYCKEFAKKLEAKGLNIRVDDRSESVGKKTRESQTQKIPFMLVAGNQEISDGTFSVRKYGEKASNSMGQDEILKLFTELNEKWQSST
jgi:threonyl-tRNA synthetase